MFLRGRPVTMYLPRDQVDSYSLEAKADLPTKRLKLEWVYPPSTDRASMRSSASAGFQLHVYRNS